MTFAINNVCPVDPSLISAHYSSRAIFEMILSGDLGPGFSIMPAMGMLPNCFIQTETLSACVALFPASASICQWSNICSCSKSHFNLSFCSSRSLKRSKYQQTNLCLWKYWSVRSIPFGLCRGFILKACVKGEHARTQMEFMLGGREILGGKFSSGIFERGGNGD